MVRSGSNLNIVGMMVSKMVLYYSVYFSEAGGSGETTGFGEIELGMDGSMYSGVDVVVLEEGNNSCDGSRGIGNSSGNSIGGGNGISFSSDSENISGSSNVINVGSINSRDTNSDYGHRDDNDGGGDSDGGCSDGGGFFKRTYILNLNVK